MKNKINMFFHCKNCLAKTSPKPHSGFGDESLSVGWTKKGLQVWCEGCNKNVMALDFLGQKIDYEN